MATKELNLQTLKNIIIVNDFAVLNGGLAKVAIDSAVGLAEAGYQVYFFALVGPVDQKLRDSNIDIIFLEQDDILSERNLLIALMRGIWNFRSAKIFKKFLADFSPDDTIIHCHGFAKALSPSVWPVILRSGIPHIFTIHDYFFVCPNGGFYNFHRKEICTLKALGLSCLSTNCDMRNPAHKIWRVIRQYFINNIAAIPRKLKHIIYISETQKTIIMPYICDQTELHYLANPISVEKKRRVKAEFNDIFLFIGRLSPEKGAVLFAEAAKQAGVKAVFVGDGPDKNRIQQANPDAVVTGWQSPDIVDKWIDKAKCLVFPSLWYEASPLVTYESLACGIPVICGDWNAASDTIQDNVTGVLVTNPTSEAFCEAINKADENIKQMSLEAYNSYWNAAPTLSRHISKLLAIYNQIHIRH